MTSSGSCEKGVEAGPSEDPDLGTAHDDPSFFVVLDDDESAEDEPSDFFESDFFESDFFESVSPSFFSALSPPAGFLPFEPWSVA